MNNIREQIKDKKRIVVKIGSSSLQHAETGDLDYTRLEKLVRELCDISNQGKEVVLVTSGAIAAGKQAVHLKTTEGQTQAESMAIKQACSAIGQARLMMTYQKLFAEYNQVAAQILMTKNTIVDNLNRYNAHNTFTQLLKMGAIPVVNENDTRMLDITITSPSPTEAASIANEYAKVASQYIADTMATDKPNIMSVALVPANPVSPNKTKNILLGMILGLVLGVGVITLRMITNDTYKTAEDIRKYTGLVTLAVVPIENENDVRKNKNGRAVKRK